MRPRVPFLMTALLVALRPGAAGERSRLARTRAALDDLEAFCARTAEATPYQHIPGIVGRRVLATLAEMPAAERKKVLDHVYESCLRAKLAVLETMDGRRRKLLPPPPFSLDGLRLEGGRFLDGDKVVFPVVTQGEQAADVASFFAQGRLRRTVPVMSGAPPDALEGSAVLRLHEADPQSHRVGWDRPAGHFLRGASEGRAAVLISLDYPPVREAIAHDAARAVAKITGEERPAFYSVGGGYFYTDYSPASAARFADWLRERHGTIRTIDAVWDTDYDTLGPQLMPAPDQAGASRARWHDWIVFNQWRLTEHVRWARGRVLEAAPAMPVGMAFSRYLFAGSLGLSGIDPEALGETLDVLELGGGDAMAADLVAAVARGRKPVVEGELAAGAFGVLPHLLHGASAVGLRGWPPAPLRSLEAVQGAERAVREALDARRLAPAIATLAGAPRPVALLYSRASMRLAPPWALRCARTPYTRRLAAAWEATRFLEVGGRFVTSADVVDRRLGAVRVLVVAGAPVEEEEVVRGLIDFVETGGHLVVIAEAWRRDGYGREADYLLRLGIEVEETRRPRFTARPRPDRGGALDALVASAEPEPAISPGYPLAAVGLREAIQGRGVHQTIEVNVRHEVLASFEDGGPAIVGFGRGKGRVTYLATPLAPKDLTLVLRAVLAQAKAEPRVRLAGVRGDEPWGVECRAAKAALGTLVSLWNTMASPRYVELQAPAVRSATDLSTGRPLEVRQAGESAVIGPLRLRPFETRIVELSPAP
ncbi:MAG: beta-galactosidase [Planctomycetota bacterium]